MLLETSRPFSPADQALLDRRLAQVYAERRAAARVAVFVLALGACAWWGEPHAGVAVGVGLLAVCGAFGVVGLIGSARREWRIVRPAVRNATAVQYEVTTHAAGRLDSGEMLLFDVGDGRLFARLADDWNRWWMLRGAFRLTLAMPSGVELDFQPFGTSFFHPRKLPAFDKLVPDPAVRQRVLARLRERPVFLGSLDAPAAALLALGQPPPPPPLDPRPPVRPDWDAIQANLEERFGHPFGVGRVAAAVGMLAEAPTPHAVAEAVGKLFPDPAPAPANATRRRIARQLRDALAVALDRPPDSIPLTAALDDLFPKAGRRRAWDVFRSGFYQTPPAATDTPGWVASVAGAGGTMGFVGAILAIKTAIAAPADLLAPWLSWGRDYPPLFAGVLLAGLPLLGFTLSRWPLVLVRRLFIRFRFPAGMATVSDLLQHALAATGPGYDPPPVERPSPGALEETIRECWTEGLGAAVAPTEPAADEEEV